jgi:hypothetical protein
MKREHLFLEQLSDTQLAHTQKIVNREVARRDSDRPGPGRMPRKAGTSGQHKAVKAGSAKKAH